MVKNIPNKFTRDLLIKTIDQNFKSTYDLFILPTDVNRYKNFGYAFLNFTCSYHIPYFYFLFNGKKWGSTNSQKICEILGGTRDDAAGECFDKIARVLGMPYPGGAALDRMSQGGDESKYVLPRAKVDGNPLDLSFSGLKTAAINLIHNAEQKGETVDVPALCASVSAAVSNALVSRTVLALEQTGRDTLAVAGGVAANSRIRAEILKAARSKGVRVCLPELRYCGDNGAMIGAQGYYEYLAGNVADMTLNAYATKSLMGEAL